MRKVSRPENYDEIVAEVGGGGGGCGGGSGSGGDGGGWGLVGWL